MYHNDLKYAEIVADFCYIPKSFCSMKVKLLGGGDDVGSFLASSLEDQNMD